MLVEHYVTRKDSGSMVGNVYLGKVQNVLPIDGGGVRRHRPGPQRRAVRRRGQLRRQRPRGRPPRIEQALKTGQSVLVQVTKDPIGHKGARLTSQVSLPGRYMVYVPDGRCPASAASCPTPSGPG